MNIFLLLFGFLLTPCVVILVIALAVTYWRVPTARPNLKNFAFVATALGLGMVCVIAAIGGYAWYLQKQRSANDFVGTWKAHYSGTSGLTRLGNARIELNSDGTTTVENLPTILIDRDRGSGTQYLNDTGSWKYDGGFSGLKLELDSPIAGFQTIWFDINIWGSKLYIYNDDLDMHWSTTEFRRLDKK